MITEDYVSFEVAKLLKEKGYCNISNTLYAQNGQFVHYDVGLNNKGFSTTLGNFYEAPTHQMTLKWLREVHKYLIVIGNKNGNYLYLIKDLKANTDLGISNNEYIRYEDVCEEAIKYCLINLIK